MLSLISPADQSSCSSTRYKRRRLSLYVSLRVELVEAEFFFFACQMSGILCCNLLASSLLFLPLSFFFLPLPPSPSTFPFSFLSLSLSPPFPSSLKVNWKMYKKGLRRVLFNMFVVGLLFNLAQYPVIKLRGNDCGYTLPTFTTTIWHLFVYIIVEEIGFYYTHRCGP